MWERKINYLTDSSFSTLASIKVLKLNIEFNNLESFKVLTPPSKKCFCLLFNNHLKLSNLAVPVELKTFILNSNGNYGQTIIKQFNNQLKMNLYLYDIIMLYSNIDQRFGKLMDGWMIQPSKCIICILYPLSIHWMYSCSCGALWD